MLGTERGRERQCRRYLGAVDQRKALFRCQHEGFQPGGGKRVFGSDDLAADAGLTDAEQRAGHVCEWCEVSRSANRPFCGDTGIDAGIDQVAYCIDQFEPDAGESPCKRHDLDDHDQADDFVRQQFANTCRMRAHEVFLQFNQLIVTDAYLRELAEARINAIGLLTARDDGIDVGMGDFYKRACLCAKTNFAGCLPHLAKFIERDRSAVDKQFHLINLPPYRSSADRVRVQRRIEWLLRIPRRHDA